MHHRNRIILLLLLALHATHARALPDDRKQPIRLQADQASFDQRSGESTYQGNVVLSQGSLKLQAAIAKVFLQAGSLTKMEASGQPVRFAYRPSVDRPTIKGTADRLVYNAAKATVVLSGNAKFSQGKDTFQGERIEYDLNTDVVNAGGGRIEFIIQPATLNQ